MSYSVKLSSDFDAELIEISEYISNDNPQTAKVFVWRVLDILKKYLSFMPMMYRIYKNEVRFIPFESYLIFYKIFESEKEVVVL